MEKTEQGGYKPNRQRIPLHVGAYVKHNGKDYRITQVLGFESVVAIDIESEKTALLPVRELQPYEDAPAYVDIAEISDKDWKEIERRLEELAPHSPSIAPKAFGRG